jgi:hypothetical protein
MCVVCHARLTGVDGIQAQSHTGQAGSGEEGVTTANGPDARDRWTKPATDFVLISLGIEGTATAPGTTSASIDLGGRSVLSCCCVLQSKPNLKISSKCKSLKEFLKLPVVDALSALPLLEEQDVRLQQLPGYTSETLRSIGVKLGTADRIVKEASKYQADWEMLLIVVMIVVIDVTLRALLTTRTTRKLAAGCDCLCSHCVSMLVTSCLWTMLCDRLMAVWRVMCAKQTFTEIPRIPRRFSGLSLVEHRWIRSENEAFLIDHNAHNELQLKDATH